MAIFCPGCNGSNSDDAQFCTTCGRPIVVQPRDLGGTSTWRERPSYTPTIVVTMLFGVFGLIPAVRHSRMARERGYSASGYWWSFWLPILVPTALVALLVVALVAAVHQVDSGATHQIDDGVKVTSLKQATKNTAAATSYTVDLQQTSKSNGSGGLHAVVDPPDRLAGYQQDSGRRVYFVVVNDTVYQTAPAKITAKASSRSYHVEHVTTGAFAQVNPLPSYLNLVNRAKNVRSSGSTYSFHLPNSTGGLSNLTYTVTGKYVTKIEVTQPGSAVNITISAINSSPQVKAPPTSSIISG